MYVFDTLISNSTRSPLSMLYGPGDFQLILVDHHNAFGSLGDRPAYLGNTSLSVGEEWQSALLEIDDESLHENLADVLDKDRLAALGKRRNKLLKNSSH